MADDTDRIRRERDGLLALMVEKGDEQPPLWHAYIPDAYSPTGWSYQEYDTKLEAEMAVLDAAMAASPVAPPTADRPENPS